MSATPTDPLRNFTRRLKLVRARTPLRISFGGGGTDVSPYPEQRGGCVLNATISLYVHATLAPSPEKAINIRSLNYDSVVNYTKPEDFAYDGQMDLAKGVFKRFGLDSFAHGGFKLDVRGDAPPGSGLGSSSTFTVTMISLFREWLGLPLNPYGMAELAYDVERNDVGIKGGRQDQYAAAFGGFNFIEFNAEDTVVTPLRLAPETIHELEYNLLLCYTGLIRDSQDIIVRQMENYTAQDGDAVAALDHTKALALEIKRALMLGRLDSIGELLHCGWEHKKRMADGITTPFIDELYAEARLHGATGGKIAGAGGGGYMLLYCPFHKKQKLSERLTAMGGQIINFQFDPLGTQSWRVFEN